VNNQVHTARDSDAHTKRMGLQIQLHPSTISKCKKQLA